MHTRDECRKKIGYLQTGQSTCHDAEGKEVNCEGTGQDAEFKRGICWPEPRFGIREETIVDRLTGLVWARNANVAQFPVTWTEAFSFVDGMNRERSFGFSDWRVPNRRELRSLMSHQERMPALPTGHPFTEVFSGWYWTSTSAAINPAYAWYIHTEGARMFYGSKTQYFLLWPVRGAGSSVIPRTGQRDCFDASGSRISCAGSGQDGDMRLGRQWPEPRFEAAGDEVIDRLTGLCWQMYADRTGKPATWNEALLSIRTLGREWRLPNINELESLVDCGSYGPALPKEHPFKNVKEGYWSSTTSMFEPDWAWALYLSKGAVGVGQKRGPCFFAWPVRDGP